MKSTAVCPICRAVTYACSPDAGPTLWYDRPCDHDVEPIVVAGHRTVEDLLLPRAAACRESVPMSESYTCECGERVDPKGSPHYCPGSTPDRFYALEREVATLKRIVARLLADDALTLPRRDVAAMLEELDP